MKKVVLLTLWLLLPIMVVGGLMAWVFITMDKDKPMMDLPAIGAGGGDTGGVNAIGELIHGNDPDAIQHAKRAQQEQIPMDPRDWPGGVVIRVPVDAFDAPNASAVLTILHDESHKRTSINTHATDAFFDFAIDPDLKSWSRFVVWTSTPMVVSAAGYHGTDNRLLRMFTIEEMVPPRAMRTSEPWVIEMSIDTIYEDAP